MKKLTSYLAVFAMVIMAVVMGKATDAQAAITFEDAKVFERSEMTNFNRDVGLTWEVKIDLDKAEGVTTQKKYAKFTLTKDSIIRFKVIMFDKESTKEYLRVYSNEAMISPVYQLENFGESDNFLTLDAGTYYMEYTSDLYLSKSSHHTVKCMIGAIPQEDPVWVEQTASADRTKVTVKVTPKFAGENEVRMIRWAEGKDATINTISAKADSQRCFTVDKNGWYTVCINATTNLAWSREHVHTFNVQVKGIGPGAKKGVTYTVKNVKYKVVKAGFDGTGTVMVTGVKKAKASVTIPDKVTIGNHDYKVVKINKKAFYKKSKIKTITIKATGITSIGKDAFKGINPKATINVPKKNYAKYKKMLTKKAGFAKKTMKIKKK